MLVSHWFSPPGHQALQPCFITSCMLSVKQFRRWKCNYRAVSVYSSFVLELILVSASAYILFVILLDGIKPFLCFGHWYVSTWIIIKCPSRTGGIDLLQLQDIKSLLCVMFRKTPWTVNWSFCFCDYITYKRWNHTLRGRFKEQQGSKTFFWSLCSNALIFYVSLINILCALLIVLHFWWNIPTNVQQRNMFRADSVALESFSREHIMLSNSAWWADADQDFPLQLLIYVSSPEVKWLQETVAQYISGVH